MTTWPIDLPQRAFLPVSEARRPAVLRSPMDAGPDKLRRRFTAAARHLTLSMLLTGEQRAVFDAFYAVDLEEGALTFDWIDPATGETVALRFREPPQYELLRTHQTAGARLWRVTLPVETLPGVQPSLAARLVAAGSASFAASGAALAAGRMQSFGGAAVSFSAGVQGGGVLVAQGSASVTFGGAARIAGALTAAGAASVSFASTPPALFFVDFALLEDDCLEDVEGFTLINPGTGADCALRIESGVLRIDTEDFIGGVYATPDSGSINHFIQAQWLSEGQAIGAGLACRVLDEENYFFATRNDFNEVQLWSVLGGEFDLVAQASAAETNPVIHFEVEAAGGSQVARIFVNDDLRIGPVAADFPALDGQTRTALVGRQGNVPWLANVMSGALSASP